MERYTVKEDCIHYEWNYEYAAHDKGPACRFNKEARQPHCSGCLHYEVKKNSNKNK